MAHGYTQGAFMQKPGEPFSGAHRMAYIPDCEQGRKAVRLLKSAFMLGSVFQVGRNMAQPLVELYGGCMVVLKVS
jgi:hypothetical protein